MKDYIQDYRNESRRFDQAVLTALLQAVTPSPEQAAIDLLKIFPSLQDAARAGKPELVKIIGRPSAKLLRTIPKAVTSMTRERLIEASNYILTIRAATQHFAALLNGRRNEAFVVLCLNTKNRLVNQDVWTGTLDRAVVYPREILRRAILVDASAVMVAHNPPSGDPTPSCHDLRLTQRLEAALDLVDVIFLDHLIFGEGEPYSLRANGDV